MANDSYMRCNIRAISERSLLALDSSSTVCGSVQSIYMSYKKGSKNIYWAHDYKRNHYYNQFNYIISQTEIDFDFCFHNKYIKNITLRLFDQILNKFLVFFYQFCVKCLGIDSNIICFNRTEFDLKKSCFSRFPNTDQNIFSTVKLVQDAI